MAGFKAAKEMANKLKGEALVPEAKREIDKLEPAADVGVLAEPDYPERDIFRKVKMADDLMEFNDDSGLKPNPTGGKFIH